MFLQINESKVIGNSAARNTTEVKTIRNWD